MTYERNLTVSHKRRALNIRTKMSLAQARREPQRGPGKHYRCPPPIHFRWAPLGRKFLNFFSKKCTLVYSIILSDGGAPDVAQPVVTYLSNPPSRQACMPWQAKRNPLSFIFAFIVAFFEPIALNGERTDIKRKKEGV